MNNSEYKFDVSDKVRNTFNRIAQWHNGDEEAPTKANLLKLSQDIVEDVLNFTLHQLSTKTKIGVECDQDALKDALKKSMTEKMEEFEKEKKKEEPPKKKGFFGLFK